MARYRRGAGGGAHKLHIRRNAHPPQIHRGDCRELIDGRDAQVLYEVGVPGSQPAALHTRLQRLIAASGYGGAIPSATQALLDAAAGFDVVASTGRAFG